MVTFIQHPYYNYIPSVVGFKKLEILVCILFSSGKGRFKYLCEYVWVAIFAVTRMKANENISNKHSQSNNEATENIRNPAVSKMGVWTC